MRTLVQGGLVVRHDGVRRADVLLEDERIVEVGEGLSASGACVVDATDCYVLPGGVDAQVRPAGAGLGGLARAALLGGTTSLGVLPPCDGSTPVTDGLPLDVVVHADAAGELPDAAACAAFPASLLTASDACTRLRGLKSQGMLPLAACGLEPVVRGMRARLEAEGQRDVQIWPQVFPAYAEETAVRLALTLAHAAESPLCLGPVSSARALTALSGGHDCGRIHACTAPRYLLLDAASYGEGAAEGLKYVCMPPLRAPRDGRLLWEALARGLLDHVVSAHDEVSYARKWATGRESVFACPQGMPGVETRLPLLFSEGVRKSRLTLPRFVDVACTTPAALLGLGERKGRLEAGFDADVVVLDPVCCRELSVRGLHQGDYTPYEGLEVQGWPRHVWARGRHVVTEGVWSGPEQGSTGPAA